ncbi:MAG: hypothetical protein Q7T82_10840 [Armatimonadota bacterium]|nr:hypothetical protein [Armatimonadota bacterium]
MRFFLGMLGGAVSGLALLICIAVASAATGGAALRLVTAVASLVLAPLGTAVVLCLCGVLGGLFTSGVCGKIAVGPAIGVGLVYGLAIWLFTRFLVLPLFPETSAARISSQPLALVSILFGLMMGIWVIVAAHAWPTIAIRCE